MSVNVFSSKVLIGDTIFTSPNGDGTRRHFTWSSQPREDLAACSAKGVPSQLHVKTLSIVSTPEIEPATSRSAVKHSTYWANRRYAVSRLHLTEDFRLLLHNVFESIRFSSSISSIKSRRYLYDPENWKDVLYVRRVFSDHCKWQQ